MKKKTGATRHVSARTAARNAARARSKVPTGIAGFDEIVSGGLPRGRTTLLTGGPGSGKTIFSVQFLAHGAMNCDEPGIFVAFEETPKRIIANLEGFGWKLGDLLEKKLFFLDAQPKPDLIQSGSFDLGGLLAGLAAKSKQLRAPRIVFDGLDILLALLPDPATKQREIYRLHQWLLAHELTAIITAKADSHEASLLSQQPFGFIQFMVDCAVVLNHRVARGISQRNLRVQKYRGSSFDENEAPFVIGSTGLDVAIAHTLGRALSSVTNERVTSGVKRLDTMLGGGYYRGAAMLIAKQVEKTLLARTTESRGRQLSSGRRRLRELRGADSPKAGTK